MLVVPRSQLRIKGVHLEVKAGNHLNTRSMCIDRADGCSVPFQVTPEGHYVQQGVALHHHRPANVPANCPIDTAGRSSVSGAPKGGSAASTSYSNSASNSCAHEKGGAQRLCSHQLHLRWWKEGLRVVGCGVQWLRQRRFASPLATSPTPSLTRASCSTRTVLGRPVGIPPGTTLLSTPPLMPVVPRRPLVGSNDANAYIDGRHLRRCSWPERRESGSSQAPRRQVPAPVPLRLVCRQRHHRCLTRNHIPSTTFALCCLMDRDSTFVSPVHPPRVVGINLTLAAPRSRELGSMVWRSGCFARSEGRRAGRDV